MKTTTSPMKMVAASKKVELIRPQSTTSHTSQKKPKVFTKQPVQNSNPSGYTTSFVLILLLGTVISILASLAILVFKIKG